MEKKEKGLLKVPSSTASSPEQEHPGMKNVRDMVQMFRILNRRSYQYAFELARPAIVTLLAILCMFAETAGSFHVQSPSPQMPRVPGLPTRPRTWISAKLHKKCRTQTCRSEWCLRAEEGRFSGSMEKARQSHMNGEDQLHGVKSFRVKEENQINDIADEYHARVQVASSPSMSVDPGIESRATPRALDSGEAPGSHGVRWNADWQQAILSAAMDEHMALRNACLVSPAEALAVEAAFEGLDDILYADSGWSLPEEEYQEIVNMGGFPTYGELLPSGVDKLVRLLGMDDAASFYDLGAGTCRSLLHLAMVQPHLTKAVGIELSPTRLEYGSMAHDHLVKRGAVMCPVELREGNVEDAIYREATHVFLSSVCFDDFLLRKIARNLGQSAHFRVLVSLRQLPIEPHLVLLGRTTLACTFHGAQPAFIYVRHGLDRTPAATLSEFLCSEGACWLPPHLQEAQETLFVGTA